MANLLEFIDKLIVERGSASILKERLEFLRDQIASLEKQSVSLSKKNIELEQELRAEKEKVRRLEDQLSAQEKSSEFVEHQGALFKRQTAGGYHEAVFCPDCYGPMFSLQDVLPFKCSKCHRAVHFTGRDLRRILRSLPS